MSETYKTSELTKGMQMNHVLYVFLKETELNYYF